MKHNGLRLAPLFILSALVLVAAQSVFLGIYPVHGLSMFPTYKDGQLILVNRLAYGFQYPIIGGYCLFWKVPLSGDSVVLHHPNQDKLLVKRVVAVQGEPLTIKDHRLFLDKNQVTLAPSQEYWISAFGRVPQGYCFVMGDNTGVSEDSRDWGFVPLSSIVGRLLF